MLAACAAYSSLSLTSRSMFRPVLAAAIVAAPEACAAFRGAQGAPEAVLALDALVFGEFLEAYCAAAADLLGAESCERGMLLGLDLLCDLSMKL